MPPRNQHLSSRVHVSENQNLVRVDPDYLKRKLTAFSCQLLLQAAPSHMLAEVPIW